MSCCRNENMLDFPSQWKIKKEKCYCEIHVNTPFLICCNAIITLLKLLHSGEPKVKTFLILQLKMKDK